jgi:thiol-disulfide isomerase/thioredoxin
MGIAHAQFEKTPWASKQKTPSFLFKDSESIEYKTENLRGKKIVLNFWATWCAPCKEELPSLQIFSDFQNPNEVKAGQQKPILKEKGPYIYRQVNTF